MRAYFLKTARIGFSAWQAEDLPFAVGLWCDPAVAGMICARGCFTQQEAADRLRLEMENLCRYGVQYYPLFLLGNDVFIGCCGLRPGSVPREFELGFVYMGDAFYAPTGLHHPTYRLSPPTAVGPEKQASEF